jgi:putative flippase GtrA
MIAFDLCEYWFPPFGLSFHRGLSKTLLQPLMQEIYKSCLGQKLKTSITVGMKFLYDINKFTRFDSMGEAIERVHHFTTASILYLIDVFYKPFAKWIPQNTFRYLACGGANAVFDTILYAITYNFILKKQELHLHFVTLSPHIAAFLLVFPITFCSGYYLNRYVVFARSGLARRVHFYRVALVSLTSVILNYAFLKLFVNYLHFYPTPSKVMATICIAYVSYLTQTLFYFKKQPEGGLATDYSV